MIDKAGVIETLKLAHDALVDTYPEVMKRIFNDDTLLEDKETPDYKTAFAICSIMDVIEQIEEEPDYEEIQYDFDEVKWHVKGYDDEFYTEGQMLEFLFGLPEAVKTDKTFVMSRSYKGSVEQWFKSGTYHIATLEKK
jgi:hypothetical protein